MGRSAIAGAAASLMGIVACGDPGAVPADGSFTVLSAPAAPAGPPSPDPALWEEPQQDEVLETGRAVWVGTCIACHSTGLGGAPLIGNRELWAPRLEKGLDTLVEHATNGFDGKVGEMPARGGNEDLSDAQVRAAVLFMTAAVDRG